MEMDVMMVGFSGVGKTSYMGALYSLMNTTGREGFTLKAADRHCHKAFMEMGNNLSEGRFPPGTAVRDEYKFRLLYDGESVFDFTWSDYRGGVLSEAGSDDLTTVVDKIVKSDALCVFLDTPAFIENPTDVCCTLKRVKTLIQNSIRQADDNSFLVAFVLTKSDCLTCEDWKKLKNNRAFEMLMAMINEMNSNEKLFGMLAATAVGVRCENIEYPFLFLMQKGMILKVQRLCKAIDRSKKRIKELQRQGGLLDELLTLGKKLFVDENAKSMYDRANEEIESHNHLIDVLRKLQKPLERVEKFVNEAAANEDVAVNIF